MESCGRSGKRFQIKGYIRRIMFAIFLLPSLGELAEKRSMTDRHQQILTELLLMEFGLQLWKIMGNDFGIVVLILRVAAEIRGTKSGCNQNTIVLQLGK